MTQILNPTTYHIARRAGDQGARSADVTALTQRPKNQLQSQTNTSLIKCKRMTTLSTFNVRTLNTTNQLSELVAILYNIDIICIQEHRFFHDDLTLKNHDVGKGWTFISASAWIQLTPSVVLASS